MSTLTTPHDPKTRTGSSNTPASATTPFTIQPYLFFDGRCDEALNFYRTALGAEITMLLRFKDGPEATCCPTAGPDKVMHASFRIGATEVLASDGRCEGKLDFRGFALSLIVPTVEEAKRVFSALERGGQVQMPLEKAFFSPLFGMVADRFGVSWMVYVTPTTP